MLTIQSISKHFDGTQALRSCSFEIPKNKITALIGPNGAGKTTLFDIISGLIKADKGKIIFQETDITDLPSYRISDIGIARTFQQVQLFKNLTIQDHLLTAQDDQDSRMFFNVFGLNKIEKEKIERIKNILEKLELNKPLKTIVTDLSYGQRKLLDLAIALLKPHQLLLLDEPVEGVSIQVREKIKDILEDLKKKGETVLIIEHDIDFVTKIADWVIVLDGGELLWQGKPEEIRQRPEIIEAYLGK